VGEIELVAVTEQQKHWRQVVALSVGLNWVVRT
jgi:hypothetical protein